MALRLLVADDHAGYRLLVRTALRGSSSFEVVGEVFDVAGVERAAAEVDPQALLVDMLLPGGGAFAAAKAVHDRLPTCAAVISSSHGLEELAAAGHIGGVAFLSKGVSPLVLHDELAAIVNALERHDAPLDEASVLLPQDRSSSADARRFCETTLERWGCDELADTVKLLVSELVSNAVLHAGTEVEVVMRLLGDRIRVEVADRSPQQIRRREAAETDTSGRGSELVDMLSRAWGLTGRPDGKSVWFELDRPQG